MGPSARWVLLGSAIALMVVGAVMGGLWPTIFSNILKSQLQLTEDSTSYGLWRETPIPMFMEFYMFNCTNTEDVIQHRAKPILVELGPYVFSEYHTKVNVTWNENETITFNQIRRWQFEPDKSNGSLGDNVTNLNVMSLATAYMGRTFPPKMQIIMNIFLRTEGSVWLTKTVGELLFDGYDDNIIKWINKLSGFTNISVPFDKFGWFYMRNESWSYDGVFNMYTGTDMIEKLGRLHSWNHYTQVPYYDGHCADVKGTAGELWPPNELKNSTVMFVSDLCRSMILDYEEDETVFGVVGRKFVADEKVVENGEDNPDNKCFTRGKEYPSGIFDVSECKFGAPAYISYPNFYLADPFYRNKVIGMKPEKDKHEFKITLEPRTGIPMNVSARLQINLHLQPIDYAEMYRNVSDVFMPMMWFAEKAAVTEDLSDQMKLLLIVPIAGTGIFFGLLALGIFLILVVVLINLRGDWKGSEGTSLVNGS